MNLSQESCKYRLCQINKSVAFSRSHFFRGKSKIFTASSKHFIIDIVSTSYSLCQSFYYFVKLQQENKVLNLSLQNEIDVLAFLRFTVECNFTVLVDEAS